MDLDHEHTVHLPVPDPDYLARARRSIQEIVHITRNSGLDITDRKYFEESRTPEKSKNDPNAPSDKGYFILITLFLLGLIQLIPYSFFFIANEYWMYKFRNISSESTDPNDRTDMQRYFNSLSLLTFTTPGLVCTFLAAVAGHKIKAETRLYIVLSIYSFILILQSILTNVDTDKWQGVFFGLSLGSSLIISCAMSLGSSGTMGLVSILPPIYMKAELMGEGCGVVFSALVRLISIIISPSVTGSALLFFITGSCLMIGMTIVLFCATKTKFFKYHTRSAKEETKPQMKNYKEVKEVVKETWPLLILPMFDMIIPSDSVIALVVSESYGTDSVWGNTYFVTVCTYLIPAFCGVFGRAIFNKFDFELPILVLYLISISRSGILGSLLFFTNAKPRQYLPVLLTHDWEYALLIGLKNITDGFMLNLSMIKIMRSVPPIHIELAMMISMFCYGGFIALTSPMGMLAVSLL